MRGFVPPDEQTEVSSEQWAVVYMPGRNRKRYPANCVQIMDSESEAKAAARPAQKLFQHGCWGPQSRRKARSFFTWSNGYRPATFKAGFLIRQARPRRVAARPQAARWGG